MNYKYENTRTLNTADVSDFEAEIVEGLLASPKYIPSKYFYDKTGDALFQQIMHSPEYYLTRCEYEIFSKKSDEIARLFYQHHTEFDLVELGAGDCFKSRFLLKALARQGIPFTFYPVDISENVIGMLSKTLPNQIPGLEVIGLQGEYLDMLEKANQLSALPKVVLFLGSNIGNMEKEETLVFLQELRTRLKEGDMVYIGYDLKKDPNVILSAYNDNGGITRKFNMNLLERINREMDANFDVNAFAHFPTYDPVSGACRSYIVSMEEQRVHLRSVDESISFKENEPIFTEISQKYDSGDMEDFATRAGFKVQTIFYDRAKWFGGAVWKV